MFGGHAVSEAEVELEPIIQNKNHENSIFVKECIRKFKAIKIEIVKEPVSGKKKAHGEKQESRKNDNKPVKNNYDRKEHLGTIEHQLTEEGDRVITKNVSVEGLRNLLNDKDFTSSNEHFSEEKLKLLNSRDCLYLFESALLADQSDIAFRLLATGNCGGLSSLANCKKANALHFFVSRGVACGVEYMLSHGLVKVNNKNPRGYTHLQWAVRNGHAKCAQLLLNHGATVSDSDAQGLMPLHWAARNGNLECVQLLLRHGANVSQPDAQGLTPLHWAATKGHAECLKLLVKKDVNAVNVPNNKGLRPIHCAVIESNEKCLKVLLCVEKIDVNLKNEHGETALHIASKLGNTPCLGMLLTDRRVDVNLSDSVGMTALSDALINGLWECVEWLLKKRKGNKIDINLVTSNRMTPLLYAVLGSSRMCLNKFLCQKGLKLDVKDFNDNTPLHCAININKPNNVKELLTVKVIRAQINEKNGDGYTALHLIFQVGMTIDLLDELLTVGGINVNLEDKNGRTPLHWAAEKGNIKFIEALLAVTGIDVNKKDDKGRTPLDCLTGAGDQYEACKKLLQDRQKKEAVK